MPKVDLGRPATYEDLVAVPDHLVAEIVDGELWTSPRPAPRHAMAESVLHGELARPFDRGRGGPGGWVILLEPELHLGEHALVPDIAGWRRERMPRLPKTAYFPLAPDWRDPSALRSGRSRVHCRHPCPFEPRGHARLQRFPIHTRPRASSRRPRATSADAIPPCAP